MKKLFYPLSILLLAAVACNKTQTILTENPKEINFKTMATKAAVADIVSGTSLPDNNWKIFVTASSKNPDASVDNATYFINKEFSTTADPVVGHDETTVPVTVGSIYKATGTPLYYPLGNKTVDFIAYAAKTVDKPVAPSWGTSPASASDLMQFTAWDTYNVQQDLLYANLNGATPQSDPRNLEFHHAQAQIVIEAAKGAADAGDIYIEKIELLDLQTTGNFVVDNSRQTLQVSWDLSGDAGADKQIPNLFVTSATNKPVTSTTLAQMGDALLVPQQPARNIKLTYKIGTDPTTYTYTYNNTRTAWLMNYKYIYQFNLTAYEITFTESVVDWTSETIVPAL